MPLETTATYIDSLNQLWPDPLLGDRLNEADNHLRLMKAAIKRTWVNVAGVVNATHTQFNHLIGLNQPPQVQFTNLREGSETAIAALNARYANSVSYAVNAGTVSYATSAGNAGDQYYGGQSLPSASITITYTTLVKVTLPRTGLYRIRVSLFGSFASRGLVSGNQPVRQMRLRVSGSASVTIAVAFGESILSKATSSASDEPRFVLMRQREAGAETVVTEEPNYNAGMVAYRETELHALGVVDVISASRSVAVEFQLKSGPSPIDQILAWSSLVRAQRIGASNGGL